VGHAQHSQHSIVGALLGLTGAILVAVVQHVAAQEAATAPQVRSIVDVVTVDVSVTGEGGKPVAGLTAGDFVVTVDGRPRRITSAEYVSAASETKGSATTFSPYSTNSASGRMIMLLIDLSAMRGRSVLEAASRFVSQLSPADRVALVAYPGTGAQIDFTRDHESVRTALSRLSGQAESLQSNFRIDLADALAAQRGDLLAINSIADRECAGQRLEDLAFCRNAVVTEATSIATFVRQRTQNTLTALRAVTDRFVDTPAAKNVVLMSDGLVIDQVSDLAWLGPGAARGQLTIHAVQLDAVGIEVTTPREGIRPGRDRAIGREGLTLVTSATRGEVFPAAGGIDHAFTRLAQTLSGYYLLGFEPESVDRDGATHRIKVDVPGKPGTVVRARSEFSIRRVAAKTDEALLTELLQAPVVATDIGLKLAAFTMRDPASAKLRVLLAVEIDRSSNPDGRVALAFALADDKGQVVGSRLDPDIKSAIRADRTQPYTNSLLTDASGPLALRVAVVDEQGRQGSVEHRFTATLTKVGALQVGDLLLADERPSGGNTTPKIAGEFTSGVVNGYLELYSDSAESLKTATVIFEVAQSEQARALDGAAARVQTGSAEQPNLRAMEGTVPTTLLAPGEYIIRAIISEGGKRIGQIARTFKVGRAAAVAKPSTGRATLTTTGRRDAVPFTSRTEKFDRASVLTPEVVGFFVERLNFKAQGESNSAPVIEHARAGRFDEAVQALSTRTGTVPAAFLSGLAQYSKGQLEPAASKFREALKLDSEFFPAAFYLGACYAAGNNDLQAIGAWHLSLVTQSDAPFIFTLLADALLRQKNPADALSVLNEAATQWPDNEEVQVRQGAALAMSGQRAEALTKYEAFLDKHPEDHDRLFAAIRVLYEARNQGKPIRSTNEDRALFDKWATAYAAAKGPQQAVIDQWRRAFNR
jgi:VWFA-related protein